MAVLCRGMFDKVNSGLLSIVVQGSVKDGLEMSRGRGHENRQNENRGQVYASNKEQDKRKPHNDCLTRDVARRVRTPQILAVVRTLLFTSVMDESREEIPRISIDSLREWHRIKDNFAKAVFEQFDQRIHQSGLESERASLLPHVQRVQFG
jgi:hypothetical protein